MSLLAEKKEKQYVSNNARLMAEWNYEKNWKLNPGNFTVNSGIKVWWKGDKGHEWQAVINSRNGGSGVFQTSGNFYRPRGKRGDDSRKNGQTRTERRDF